MASQPDNPRLNLVESLKDRRDTIQQELFRLKLDQSDVALAGQVRGLIAELRARQDALDDVEKFFEN